MINYTKHFICILCLFMFSLLSFYVYTENNIIFDDMIYSFIDNYFICDSMTIFFNIITWFGSTYGIIIICIISLFIFKDKKINISIVSNLVIVTILNNILKIIFMRERPSINQMVIENSYSFPSGHSMVSMAFYGYLIYLIYNKINNKKVKWILISLLSILILLIGISRIYLGVHYASDVIGGFTLSIAYLIIFISISNRNVNTR